MAVAYLTTPQLSQEEIEQWIADGLTLEEWAEKIKVPADAFQMLTALDYGEVDYQDNVTFHDNSTDTEWSGSWNPHEVFAHRSGRCGGTSNLINFLLSGDFGGQGYVEFSNNNGGHAFNYFLYNGVYVMCDFVGIPGMSVFNTDRTIPANTRDYIVYAGTDVHVFGDWYRAESGFDFDNPESEDYLYDLWLYPRDGLRSLNGFDRQSKETPFNTVWDVLPAEYKDDFVILYEREGNPLRFCSPPPQSSWPSTIR